MKMPIDIADVIVSVGISAAIAQIMSARNPPVQSSSSSGITLAQLNAAVAAGIATRDLLGAASAAQIAAIAAASLQSAMDASAANANARAHIPTISYGTIFRLNLLSSAADAWYDKRVTDTIVTAEPFSERIFAESGTRWRVVLTNGSAFAGTLTSTIRHNSTVDPNGAFADSAMVATIAAPGAASKNVSSVFVSLADQYVNVVTRYSIVGPLADQIGVTLEKLENQ